MNEGWVYGGELSKEGLENLISSFQGLKILSWDLERLDSPSGVDLRFTGCAFAKNLEIRWEAISPGGPFQVLVLSDSKLEGLPIKLIPGSWERRECTIMVSEQAKRRFGSQFGIPSEREDGVINFRCQVFLRDGIVTFVSSRGADSGQKS
jgi:hypothetical protein